MNIEDMYNDTPVKEFNAAEILNMWEQARGELGGFARALERKSGITAAQLRMALQLADEAFAKYKE